MESSQPMGLNSTQPSSEHNWTSWTKHSLCDRQTIQYRGDLLRLYKHWPPTFKKVCGCIFAGKNRCKNISYLVISWVPYREHMGQFPLEVKSGITRQDGPGLAAKHATFSRYCCRTAISSNSAGLLDILNWNPGHILKIAPVQTDLYDTPSILVYH